jgi:hypothetical protein
MDKLYRISQLGTRVGRSAQELRVMDCAGTFPAKPTPTPSAASWRACTTTR